MNRRTLKALERHATAAADIIRADVLESAAAVLADPEARPGDSLAALVDAQMLYGVAAAARTARKEV
jgi:hypothetical protein